MITKFGKQICLLNLTQMRLIKQLRSRDKLKSLNCTTTVPLPTKLGKMITYLNGLLPIKLHDLLMT